MKRTILFITVLIISTLTCTTTQAQFKMHSNGRISFQSTANTTTEGIVFNPYPNWSAHFNGDVYLHNKALFVKQTTGYQMMNTAFTTNPHASTWAVAYPDWNVLTFYVRATGYAYAVNFYTISNPNNNSKGNDNEPITGTTALEVLSGLQGYYHAPEEQEIPDLEHDENVDPEAVEAMYADFSKRSVGLLGSDFVEAFPEGVRTDPQNRLCINYSSVVTMLVEAVKEQQREIEELRKTLKETKKP